jgi:putative transposase
VRLVQRPEDRSWSSAAAHLRRRDNALVSVRPSLEILPRPEELFEMSPGEASELFGMETKSMMGRPLGSAAFIADVEKRLGRSIAPKKRRPKPKTER